MTAEEVLTAAKNRKWYMYEGLIRCESGLCPLVAAAIDFCPEKFFTALYKRVGHRYAHSGHFAIAAEVLEYDGDLPSFIGASDRYDSDRHLRRTMLRILSPINES